MRNKIVKENGFEGAVGGSFGTVNTQPGMGTFGSNDARQNPDAFYNSNNNKAIGANSNTTGLSAESGSMNKEVDKLFAGKNVPSPDEIVTGIKYEMGQQIKKDKIAAKRLVIQNLKKDPKFYSSLKMLNIDDSEMFSENKKTHITKAIEQTRKDMRWLQRCKF